jgi:hypothetical protein
MQAIYSIYFLNIYLGIIQIDCFISVLGIFILHIFILYFLMNK